MAQGLTQGPQRGRCTVQVLFFHSLPPKSSCHEVLVYIHKQIYQNELYSFSCLGFLHPLSVAYKSFHDSLENGAQMISHRMQSK